MIISDKLERSEGMIKKLLCKILNHRLYKISQTRTTEWVKCVRCQRQFFLHHPTRSFLPYDSELYYAFVDEKERETTPTQQSE